MWKRRDRWKLYLLLLLASNLVQWFIFRADAPNGAATSRPAATLAESSARDIQPSASHKHSLTVAARSASVEPSEGSVRLAYVDVGKGRPVLLLHGSPGSSADFRFLMPLLAGDHRRCIAPDLPGFGDSEPYVPDFGNRAHARYALALLDELKIESFDVIAFSMGGGVALNLYDLSPNRIRSIIFYGGIGCQEGEGSGDYTFEHLKYALGYGGLVVLPELIPHFGLLGPRAARNAFIRNFYDSDQRPYREIVKRINVPFLILNGKNDPLVPVWLAREHHRLVPSSELVVFDASHFMLFGPDTTKRLADEIVPFLNRVDAAAIAEHAPASPKFPGRTVDPFADQPAESLLPIQLKLDRAMGPWLQTAALAASTTASEDMTCIAAGLLARDQQIDIFVAILGCFIGIYLGDLGLWLIGRIMGRRAMRWGWVARKLPQSRMDAWGHWFDRRGARAVIASRFMPGTRVPVYIAAGIVGNRPFAFMLWTLIAVAIWTPLVVVLTAIFGPTFVRPAMSFFGSGWIAVLAAAVALFMLLRAITLALTQIGRARLMAKVSKLWRWEFWSTWYFYIPLYPWILWLAIRHRGLTVPTAANPGIANGGGFIGESKCDILSKLPAEHVLPFTRIEPGETPERLRALERIMSDRGWQFPLILKPDSGERGTSVRLVKDAIFAATCFDGMRTTVVTQVYHPGPFEAGIFYYRMPGEGRGRIFSITDKHFSYLTGDGVHNVEQLIWRHPRYRMQASRFLARLGAESDRVLAEGERLRLAMAGNHCQGTLFKDGAHLITPELESAIDAVAQAFEGFYFGRFDVRYSDVDAFRAGRDFKIIELNGVTSESTNIYDPDWSILRAYATLYRQWAILFAIGAANRKRGVEPLRLGEILRATRDHYRKRKLDPMAD